MFTVYVLYSNKYDKIYIGFTSDMKKRLLSHNDFGKGYTRRYRPWIIAFEEKYESKKEAMKRETYLKSGIGREYIWYYIRSRQ